MLVLCFRCGRRDPKTRRHNAVYDQRRHVQVPRGYQANLEEATADGGEQRDRLGSGGGHGIWDPPEGGRPCETVGTGCGKRHLLT